MSEVECPNCGHLFEPGIDPEWVQRVRSQRIAKHVTLRALASHLGLSAPYVNDIELRRRNKPRPEIVRAWESYLESQP